MYAPGLSGVRTGHTYQPPALGTYRRRRAACPRGPAYCTYGVRVPASAVPCVLRTVAPQATSIAQLEANWKAATFVLPAEALAEIDAIHCRHRNPNLQD